MKKMIAIVLCLTMIVSTGVLSGCSLLGGQKRTGKEVAKMLLANSRLDTEDLALSLEKAMLGTEHTKSADSLSAPKGSGIKVMQLSTATSGNTVSWRDFTDESNTYSFFRSYFANIEHSANMFAQEIERIKSECGNSEYWMRGVGTEEKFLLRVEENQEIIFAKDEDSYRVCRRYTNENADDVYEIYSTYNDSSYEERCLYIAGKRYEFACNFGGYDGIYIVAENTRGYWNMFQVTDIEPGRANIMNFVSSGSLAFTFSCDILPDVPGEQQSMIRFSTADLTNDVITFGTGTIGLNISAFNGVDHIEADASGVNSSEGSNALVNQMGTLVTTSGKRISTGDSFLDDAVSVIGMTASFTLDSYGPGNHATNGHLELRVAGDTTAEQLANLKAFLSQAGLSCRYSLDALASNLPYAVSLSTAFPQQYRWNGFGIDSYAGIQSAVAQERALYEQFQQMYEEVKDLKSVSINRFGASFENWDFSQISSVTGDKVTLSGDTITVENMSVVVEDTALFDAEGAYTIRLALAKFVEGSETDYDNAVILPCEGADMTVFTGGSITLNQSAVFTIPQFASVGQYTIVAYVATDDGIRVSEMAPVIFTEDISEQRTVEGLSLEFATNADRELRIHCELTETDYKKPEEPIVAPAADKTSGQGGRFV